MGIEFIQFFIPIMTICYSFYNSKGRFPRMGTCLSKNKYIMIGKRLNQLSLKELKAKADRLRDAARFTIVCTVLYSLAVVFLLFKVTEISAFSKELMTLAVLVSASFISVRRLRRVELEIDKRVSSK